MSNTYIYSLTNLIFSSIGIYDRLCQQNKYDEARMYLNKADDHLEELLALIENDPDKNAVIYLVSNTLRYIGKGYSATKKEILGNSGAMWHIT